MRFSEINKTVSFSKLVEELSCNSRYAWVQSICFSTKSAALLDASWRPEQKELNEKCRKHFFFIFRKSKNRSTHKQKKYWLVDEGGG